MTVRFGILAALAAAVVTILLVRDNSSAQVKVPKLAGVSLDRAAALLADRGLRVAVSSWPATFNDPRLVVEHQWTVPGTHVRRGSAVDLWVSERDEVPASGGIVSNSPAKMLTVPNIVGLRLSRALDLLRRAGFQAEVAGPPALPPVRIRDPLAEFRVTSQRPRPGARFWDAVHGPVALVLSRAP